MDLEVECYAAHKGEETPRRFRLGGRTIEVIEVLDAWLSPDHGHFKVRGSDGATYILRHGAEPGGWTLEFYDAAGRNPLPS
jgi:hypothetical protein